jgi:hypothetical protein
MQIVLSNFGSLQKGKRSTCDKCYTPSGDDHYMPLSKVPTTKSSNNKYGLTLMIRRAKGKVPDDKGEKKFYVD